MIKLFICIWISYLQLINSNFMLPQTTFVCKKAYVEGMNIDEKVYKEYRDKLINKKKIIISISGETLILRDWQYFDRTGKYYSGYEYKFKFVSHPRYIMSEEDAKIGENNIPGFTYKKEIFTSNV